MKPKEKLQNFSLEKQALYALEVAEQSVKKAKQAIHEPIAIVGMNCKFPGGVTSKEEFWDVLNLKKDVISEVSPERWSNKYFNENKGVPGTTYAKHGAFINDIFGFDANFFGISTAEATSMDPQQRLLLETTWHALEDAGMQPKHLKNEQVGIFVGIGQIDYGLREMGNANLNNINAYSGPGLGGSFAAGRLAYFLGTQGPTISMDTACSSALVSVHQACNSLRLNECNVAIAGGVHLMLSPEITITLSKAGALSPNGRCSTFSDKADGYVRGEGCGMVVLKKLSDAEKDGDTILAIIKGSAVNHDGPSSGLTVPNGKAQEALIEKALKASKTKGEDISYIETHGTGTPLGDPIEVEAIVNTLGANRSAAEKLVLGAVKTNIGHLEPAAGIAGLIKIVMAMQHKKIPGNLNYERPNPILELEKQPVSIVTDTVAWAPKQKRIAALNAFGLSGTNAHMIFEEYDTVPSVKQEEQHDTYFPFVFSAKTERTLKHIVQQYLKMLQDHDFNLESLSQQLNVNRSKFSYRLAFKANTQDGIIKQLNAYLNGEKTIEKQTSRVVKGALEKTAFLFPGQGAQFEGYAADLYKHTPVFKSYVNACLALLQDGTAKVLRTAFESGVHTETQFTHEHVSLYLYITEYALAKYWIALGVTPNTVSGYSLGEFTAATIAGVLSIEDGLKMVAKSAILVNSLAEKGALISIFETKETILKAITVEKWQLEIGAINTASHVLVSGIAADVEKLRLFCEANSITYAIIQNIPAYHSAVIDPILNEFEQFASQITHRSPKLPMLSGTTGKRVSAVEVNAAYWRNVLRQSVNYDKVAKRLVDNGHSIYMEMGPNTMLLSLVRQVEHFETNNAALLPSIRRIASEYSDMLYSVVYLFLKGIDINWQAFYKNQKRSKIDLPLYPFDKSQKYKVERVEVDAFAVATQQLEQNRLPKESVEDIILGQIIEVTEYVADDLETINSSSIGALGLDSLILMTIRERLLQTYSSLKDMSLSLFEEDVQISDLIKALNAHIAKANAIENEVEVKDVSKILDTILLTSVKEVTDFNNDDDALIRSSTIETLDLDSLLITTIKGKIQNEFPELETLPISVFSEENTIANCIASLEHYINEGQNASKEKADKDSDEILNIFKVWENYFNPDVVTRIDKKLVHKDYDANVLVARIDKYKTDVFVAEISQDITHSFFYEHAKDHVTGVYILEAVSQIARAIPHMYYDTPYTTSYILNEVTSSFHRFAETNKPLFTVLRVSDKAYKKGALHYLKIECDIIQDQIKIGTVSGLGQLIDGERYGQMREESLSKI